MSTNQTQDADDLKNEANTDTDRQEQRSPSTGRRDLLKGLVAGATGGMLASQANLSAATTDGPLTSESIKASEWIAGIELTDDERKKMVESLSDEQQRLSVIRRYKFDHQQHPASEFSPLHSAGQPSPNTSGKSSISIDAARPATRPQKPAELAFLPVTELAALLRSKQITSTELTKLYLDRLKKFDPKLLCVVELTEALALEQAARADKEIAEGKYRGPLHGIPWGAKDLIAVKGYRTTWGALPYKDRKLDVTATVAQKLEAAGAVLVAKLTLGALAEGDLWFGGMTRNPWDLNDGSSGSSAGSASAVAAGLVGFAIGSETLGSIVSPCTRCGATGLRPTFGRVSRHGCMTLSWTMDKLGPIARSVADCGHILAAIHGADPQDPSTVAADFAWPTAKSLSELRVGYFADGFAKTDEKVLEVLRRLNVKLLPITLPRDIPANALTIMLTAEAAAAHADLIEQGGREGLNNWAMTLREARFVSAVDYIRASQIRALLCQAMSKVFEQVDVYVGGGDLVITNLTGHPTVVMPNGFPTPAPTSDSSKANDQAAKSSGKEKPETPVDNKSKQESNAKTEAGKQGDAKGKRGNGQRRRFNRPLAITMTGRLFGEADLLTLAAAYQDATKHHLVHPRMFLEE